MTDETKSLKDTIDPAFSSLLAVYSQAIVAQRERQTETLLEVDTTGSRLSSLYERLRQVVDYKEEHLVLRSIIARILKRRLLNRHTDKFGEGLVKELTLAGYLVNKSVPVSALADIDRVVERYRFLTKKATTWGLFTESLPNVDCLWVLAAAEIEMIVVPHDTEIGLVSYAVEIFKSRTDVAEKYIYYEPAALDVALTLAAHRVILKADSIAVAHRLLLLYIPNWPELTTAELKEREEEIKATFQHINGWLQDAHAGDLMRHLQQFAVSIEVIDQTLKAATATELTQMRHSPSMLHERARQQYQKLQQQVMKAFRGSVLRAGIYILLTKALLGLLVEIPLEMVMFGDLTTLPLILNTIIPPLLLFSMYFSPSISRKNQVKVLDEVEAITYQGRNFGNQEKIVQLDPDTDTGLLPIFYLLLYIIYAFIIGGIGWILYLLDFTVVSGFFFYLFVSIVIYFSVRLSAKKRSIVRTPVKQNVFGTMILMPFLTFGKFLNATFAQFNLFTITLDFLLEAPFKSFIELLSSWRRFVDTKNNELY